MIKTEARKTWSDRVNFTLQNKFSWTFKSVKTHELSGAPPLDHRQGRSLRSPGALRWTPRPHPCWASRQAACSAGFARKLFPI